MDDERRLVTVLFADVVGSTALSDGMDPEDTRVLMRRYFDHATAVIDQAGGRLEKFIGDAVVAVFGIPRTRGDDVERALNAALRLHAAVAADDILGHLLRLRIGINLGEVMANADSAADQFIATGDAMNTAARLQQAAEPGEVLVSDRFYLAAMDAFEFGPPRIVQMKGKAGTHKVHPVLRPRASVRTERPPLVGRRHDLLQLRLSAERVTEEHRAGLVTILGAPGIGKTRLVEEFIADLPPEFDLEVVTVAAARQQAAAFSQLRSLLDGLIGAPATFERVLRIFRDGDYSADQIESHARDVMAAIGDGGRVGEDRRTMVIALRAFAELVTRGRSVILVFDDAHEAADLVLDLVEQLAQPRGSRMLLVVLARPELLDRRPGWGAGRMNHTSLPLRQLSDTQVQSLVKHYLYEHEDSMIEVISRRATGNPFFALEFIRAVAHGVMTADALASGSGLPDTVHAAVLARLDLLGDHARDVLRLVAVAGTALPRAMYARLLPDRSEADVDRGVEELLAQHFVQLEAARRVAIRHSLVREVAYGTLSRAICISLHSGVAAALGDLDDGGGGDIGLAIGQHYLAALEMSRRSAVPLAVPFGAATAVPKLMAAAMISSRAGQTLDALELAEAALTIATADQRPQVLELLGTLSGVSANSLDYLQRALDSLRAAEGTPDSVREAGVRLRRKVLMLLLRAGFMDRLQIGRDVVLAHYLGAHRLAADGVSADELNRLRTVDLFLFFHRQAMRVVDGVFVPHENPAELIEIGRAVVEHFLEAGDTAGASEALDGCYLVSSMLGGPELTLEFCQRRIGLADLPPIEFGDALAMLAQAYAAVGDPLTGLETIEKEVGARRQATYATFFAHPLSVGLTIAYSHGNWDIADRLGECLIQAHEDALAFPQDKAFCVEGFFGLLRISLARADRESAARFASMLTDCLRELPATERFGQALIELEMRDEAYDSTDGLETFSGHVTSVIAFNNERGHVGDPRLIEAAVRKGSAESGDIVDVAHALRDGDHAKLTECIGALDRQGRIVTAARLRIVLGERTGDPQPLQAARRALEPLQDRRFLQRLERAERASGRPN